jgi:hypothetical protein
VRTGVHWGAESLEGVDGGESGTSYEEKLFEFRGDIHDRRETHAITIAGDP